ncbi:maltase A2-like [Adelges cooleyi]|uniref:maltase A2-like n=1 Tax=Adelges cooleyi TaxID=133065 RepID=UPI00217F4D72|nr:maltase A2-like [Adelges cooleyi]XP_050421226.1 maltase A2-like [Adelges cooleyi]
MSSEKEDGAVEKLMEEGPKQVESVEDKYDKLKEFDMAEHVETAYAGMGKEELLKYANSPFWVRLRWLLFVAFWLSWFAMMFGALFIIFMAPKCFPQRPIEWYQKSPVYIINAANLGKEGVDAKIDYIKKLGIENVVLSSALHGDNDQVIDFLKVNASLGTIDSMKDLITKLKSKGLKVMLKIVPNQSSLTNMFFERSVMKENEFKDYYVWSPGQINDKGNFPINNWLSVNGGSAWTWHESRREFYLHQFSDTEPDFNFRNKDVVKYFEDVFKFWLDAGVDGLYLDKVQYLFEDKSFQNETINSKDANARNYNSYSHTFTTDLPETYQLLSKWGELISKKSGFLILSDVDSKNISGVNIAHSPIVLPSDFTGEQLLGILVKKTSSHWPSWEWTCGEGNNCWKNETLEAFNILSSLLKGTPVIQADNNIFANNLIPNITLVDSTLKELRATPAFEYGSFNAKLISDDNVLVFDRVISSSESYLFAWNLSKNTTTISLKTKFEEVPKDAQLILCTTSACPILPPLKSKVDSYNLSIAAESAVVLSF